METVINYTTLKKPLVILLMGPTACGKTSLAMKLRELLPIELISVDSALIYRDMNIGTAKPSDADLLKHPHFLINIRDPSEIYSVGEFHKDSLKAIKDIHLMNKVPLLVGGSMFYFKVLLNGLPMLPPSNQTIRNYLLHLSKNKCNYFLFNKLKIIDIESSKRIHPNDIQRILRALEVFFISGSTVTELTKLKNFVFPYNTIKFSLMPESKNWLVDKITKRFERMLSTGFKSEVESLFIRSDLNENLPSMRCVGYRQMWDHLANRLSYNDMIIEALNATKKLAKCQLTWLKYWKNLYILNSGKKIDDLSSEMISIITNYIY